MVVYDQIETEPVVVYSGSYTDNVMYGEFFSTTYWQVPFSRSQEPPSNVGPPPRFVIASHVSKFKNVGPTSKDYDEPPQPNGNTFYPPSSSNLLLAEGATFDDVSIFHLYFAERFFSATKNSVSIKFNCEEEIFADSVMPYPPEIVLTNGGQFVEGAYQYYDESYYDRIVAMPREPRRFELCLGSPAASPDGGQSYATMTSSTDGSQVSDNAWCVSYPFEGKYRNVPRYLNMGYAKDYAIDLTQSVFPKGSHQAELQTYTNPTPFTSSMWTMNWVFEYDDKQFNTESETLSRTDVYLAQSGSLELMNRLFFEYEGQSGFINVAMPKVSSSIDKQWHLEANKYPSVSELYRLFFGFYHSGINPYQVAQRIETSKSLWNNTGKFPFNPYEAYTYAKDWGVDYFIAGNPSSIGSWLPISSSQWRWGSYRTARPLPLVVGGGSDYYNQYWSTCAWIGYIRLNGYKYGCYWPTPVGTHCYFRRNKFGQMRDMMEQRPYTKFYDPIAGTPLAAAVTAVFTSGTQVWLTSSNPDLNTRDSGIYDFEGKSGQPFADRDRE